MGPRESKKEDVRLKAGGNAHGVFALGDDGTSSVVFGAGELVDDFFGVRLGLVGGVWWFCVKLGVRVKIGEGMGSCCEEAMRALGEGLTWVGEVSLVAANDVADVLRHDD